MKGKVALVTGGGRGIGKGIVLALAGEGWTVAVNYRSDGQSAEETAAAARKLGGGAFIVQADIGEIEAHEKLVEDVVGPAGRIDLLVNNAGIAPAKREDLLHMPPESYDKVMNTNLRGPFFLTQKIAQVMIELIEKKKIESPNIITITSVSAVTAGVNRGEYCMSKAGLSMMSSLWAARLGEYGIGVFEIRPGIIETDMTAGVREKYDRRFESGLALYRRWGRPEDIGRAVAAIAAGSFPYSTGEIINIDGGIHVPRL